MLEQASDLKGGGQSGVVLKFGCERHQTLVSPGKLYKEPIASVLSVALDKNIYCFFQSIID